MDWRAPLLRRAVFARQLRHVFSVIRSVHVFALVGLVSACTPRMTPIPESSPKNNVSLVQVMYDDRISQEAKKAASRMGITGRLMYAVSRELQRRERWSTDAGTRLTIRSSSGLEQAGIVVREHGTFRLAERYQHNPFVATDYEIWKSFNDRFVRTRDMGDEIVFRLAPKQTSISFHPTPVNRFHATHETVIFQTRTFIKALVRAHINLESSIVARIPRGLMLPIVTLLRSAQLPCHDL